MRFSISLPVLLGLFLVTQSAFGTETVRPYLSADVGASFVDLSDAESDLEALAAEQESQGRDTSKSIDDRDVGFFIGVGVRLTPYVSVEMNYYDFGEFDAELTVTDGDTSVTRTDELEFSGFGPRIIGHLPVADRWTIDLAAGVARISTERNIDRFDGTSSREKSTDTVLNVGFGGQYHVTDNWAVRGMFTHFNNVGDSSTGRDDVQIVTLGGVYTF